MPVLLRKLPAAWLIVLVLSPFTAPFSICDLPALLRPAHGHAGDAGRPFGSQAALTDAALLRVARVLRAPGRSRSIVILDRGLPQSVTDRADGRPSRRSRAAGTAPAASSPLVLRI